MSVFDLRRPTYRALARVLIYGQLLLGGAVRAGGKPGVAAPAAASTPTAPTPRTEVATPAPAPPVKVNRTVPKVQPPSAYPRFSENPTTEDLFRARVFEEPLVPVGGIPSEDETRALAKAIDHALRFGRPEDFSAYESFLERHPDSAWRASLLLNLGIVWRKAGFYSRALNACEEAWALTKEQRDAHGRAVADRALAEWMEVSVQFGRVEELEKRVAEIQGRDIGGSAGERVEVAREGLAFFKDHHEDAIPSGPAALDRLLGQGKPEFLTHPKVQAFKASHHGATINEIAGLAQTVGLPMQVAFRNPGAEPPARSILHWKLGHFSAIVRVDKEAGRYLIHDPILGQEIWLSRRVLDEEGSGYYLVPGGTLARGFRSVGKEEASQVRGKCGPKPPSPPSSSPSPGGPPQVGVLAEVLAPAAEVAAIAAWRATASTS